MVILDIFLLCVFNTIPLTHEMFQKKLRSLSDQTGRDGSLYSLHLPEVVRVHLLLYSMTGLSLSGTKETGLAKHT